MRGFKKFTGTLLTLLSLLAASNALAQGATADQYLAAGNQMLNARNYTQALQYLGAAIKMNPNDPRAYQLAGNCYYYLGNKAYALAYYQRALALQPGNTQLAQLVQSLQAQTNAGVATAPAAAPATADPLSQGAALFQQRQYAAAIPYFQQAAQQNPNDYRGYYYAGYSYYMIRDNKNAALNFAIANAKQPNASIKAYADRIKASLSADDQQWVDDQVSKYSQGSAVAGGKKKRDLAFGVNILGGMDLILSTQTQVEKWHPASMAITGVAPTQVMAFGIEPNVLIGDTIEIDLAFNYLPVGQWYYTTYDYAVGNINGSGAPDVWKYTYNMSVITANLGGKIFFGGKDVKGYLGLSAGVSPISMSFSKISYDQTGTNAQISTDASSGTYSTMALSANAKLGVNFYFSPEIGIGPYVGFQYLSATNFTSGGKTLMVDTKNGAVGTPDTATAMSNMPATDSTEPFQFDFTGITGGIDITFSF